MAERFPGRRGLRDALRGRLGGHGRAPARARAARSGSGEAHHDAPAGTSLAGTYDADAGLPFSPDRLESSVIWMWGSPRSGSTWLLRMLCHPMRPHPRAPAGFEMPEGTETIDSVPVDESFLANHLAPNVGEGPEREQVFVPGTLNNLLGHKAAYAFSEAFEEVWEPEFRRLALVRLHAIAERARREGMPVVEYPATVVKEVNGSHAADLISRMMPRSRMLFLVRDGRDVVDSLVHAYQPGGFLARSQGVALKTPEQRAEGVRWAAKLWSTNVDVVLGALDSHEPALVRTVRYEDLLADTTAEIAALLQWAGIERSAAWTRKMVEARAFRSVPAETRGETEPNRSATPGRWRRNLSDSEQQDMVEIMGARLARLGYAS